MNIQNQLFSLLCAFLISNYSQSQTYSDLISDNEIISFISADVKSLENSPELPFPWWTWWKNRKVHYKINSWNYYIEKSPVSDEDELFNNLRRGLSDIAFSGDELSELKTFDSIFTKEDEDFMVKQIKSIKDTIWRKRIPGAIRKKKCNNKCFDYSLPLFSKDKKHVIVQRGYQCGLLCAYSGKFIYRRTDKNRWELVINFGLFMS